MIPAVVVCEEPDYSVPPTLVYTFVHFRGAFISHLYLWRYVGGRCQVSFKENGMPPCALHGSWEVLTHAADGLPGEMEIRFHFRAEFGKTWHTKRYARRHDSLTWTLPLPNTSHDQAVVLALAQLTFLCIIFGTVACCG